MKHKITRTAAAVLVAATLTTATVAPAQAATAGERQAAWICRYFPVFC